MSQVSDKKAVENYIRNTMTYDHGVRAAGLIDLLKARDWKAPDIWKQRAGFSTQIEGGNVRLSVFRLDQFGQGRADEKLRQRVIDFLNKQEVDFSS